MENISPALTVIVCTYNRQDYVLDCLKSLINQKVEPGSYNILVIDNASTDNTNSIVSDFIQHVQFSNIKLILEPNLGLSFARNRGLNEAKTDYIAYIDDDARVECDWIETALQIISDFQPDIFGGPAYPIFPSGKPEWFKDEYGIRGDMGETGFITEGFIVGTNIFFRKSLLQEYSGFNPELGMKGNTIAYHEETILVHRAFREKRRVFFSKELAVRDLIPDYKKSLAFFLHSKYQAGKYGLELWNPVYKDHEIYNLLKLISDTMNEFDTALMRRDVEKYPYPENYIIENVRKNFLAIGLRVEYFLRKYEFQKKE